MYVPYTYSEMFQVLVSSNVDNKGLQTKKIISNK